MCCRAETKGKSTPVDAPEHGAMQGARLMRHDRVMQGESERATCAGCARGVASSVWAHETISRLHDPSSARTCLKCARSFGRAKMFQVRTTLRACTTFSRAESHLSHLIPPNPTWILFSAGIVSPRTWTECAWAAKRRVSESCVVKSRWLESDQSRQDQGCSPPSPTASKARRSAAGSRDRRVCRRLGISRPQHCESRAFAVVSKA